MLTADITASSTPTSLSDSAQPHIVIVGANYGGLSVAKNLYARFIAPSRKSGDDTEAKPEEPTQLIPPRVTLIDKRDGFLHLIGMCRAVVDVPFGDSIWLPHADCPWLQHPMFQREKGKVVSVHPHHLELEDGRSIDFDYLVIATGLTRAPPIWPQATDHDEYKAEIRRYLEEIKPADRAVVVGGGAVGVEIAAEIKEEFPEKHVTLVHSRELPIVGPFIKEFRTRVVEELEAAGVEVILGERVVSEKIQDEASSADGTVEKTIDPSPKITNKSATATAVELTTSSGRVIHADWVINCTGAGQPASDFLHSLPATTDEPLTTKDGLIRVKKNLQLIDPAYSHIFAIGDVNDLHEVKLAGGSIYMGYFVAKNLLKLMQAAGHYNDIISDSATADEVEAGEDGLFTYPEYPPQLVLLLGKKHGVAQYLGQVWEFDWVNTVTGGDTSFKKCADGLALFGYPDSLA
ncbi:uncharacterized protein VTP21DRAFT_1678 [Calcarisporiella thermophila]|uniref:uncharacterized protein n=1 Tax=Calcarisporiella thermophila TaxID=911321 RepID=UPI0037445F30